MAMRSALIFVAALAVFALLLGFQWLFFAMLVLFVALALVEYYSPSPNASHSNPAKTNLAEKKTNPILDHVAGSLVADETKKHLPHKKEEHKEGEKKNSHH